MNPTEKTATLSGVESPLPEGHAEATPSVTNDLDFLDDLRQDIDTDLLALLGQC